MSHEGRGRQWRRKNGGRRQPPSESRIREAARRKSFGGDGPTLGSFLTRRELIRMIRAGLA